MLIGFAAAAPGSSITNPAPAFSLLDVPGKQQQDNNNEYAWTNDFHNGSMYGTVKREAAALLFFQGVTGGVMDSATPSMMT